MLFEPFMLTLLSSQMCLSRSKILIVVSRTVHTRPPSSAQMNVYIVLDSSFASIRPYTLSLVCS